MEASLYIKWHETRVGESSESQTQKSIKKHHKFLDDQKDDPPFFVLLFFLWEFTESHIMLHVYYIYLHLP